MKTLYLLLTAALFTNVCYGAEADEREKPKVIKGASYYAKVMYDPYPACMNDSPVYYYYYFYTFNGDYITSFLIKDVSNPSSLLDKDAPKPRPTKCRFEYDTFGKRNMRDLKRNATLSTGTYIVFLDKSDNVVKSFNYDPRTKEVSTAGAIGLVKGIAGLADQLNLDLSNLKEVYDFEVDQEQWLAEYNETWACTIL